MNNFHKTVLNRGAGSAWGMGLNKRWVQLSRTAVARGPFRARHEPTKGGRHCYLRVSNYFLNAGPAVTDQLPTIRYCVYIDSK